jgi:hypothetical protein
MVFGLWRIRDKLLKPLLTETREQARLVRDLLTETREQTRLVRDQHDFLLSMKWAISAQTHKNPLNRCGAKFFSQSDEDGITLEIVKRLGLKNGTFLELGVGNGLENNTLVLLSIGWRGAWIGGEELAFNHHLNPRRFSYEKAWITLDNIASLTQEGLSNINTADVDVLCVDLDGNDLYFTEALLNVLHPALVIVEYNAKFPPPARWSVPYDPNFTWDLTDYQGASLASFCDLLSRFCYALVCCNGATGVNAFFVRNEHLTHFHDVPKDMNDLFIPRQFELPVYVGHPPSPKTVEAMLTAKQPSPL